MCESVFLTDQKILLCFSLVVLDFLHKTFYKYFPISKGIFITVFPDVTCLRIVSSFHRCRKYVNDPHPKFHLMAPEKMVCLLFEDERLKS